MIRLDRKAVIICIIVCFVAMVTGVLLQLHLHLLSREHSQKHDFDNCSICQQLLVSPKKFAAELQTYLPDKELHKDNFEFTPQFCIAAFHCKPFDARPPPSFR